jgi:hypothetical protein
MGERFCRYNSKEYTCKIAKDKITLISCNMNNGFECFKDVLGNICANMFSKTIDINEAEMIYEINFKVLYQDEYFETMGIDKIVLDNERVVLVTPDENLAKKYVFFKHGQFDFLKEVSLDEITELEVEKKPLHQFKDLGSSFEIFDIKEYLRKKYYKK